jgi:arylsulfatase A-like enzyme
LNVGVWDVHGGRDFIHLDVPLLPQSLKSAGYATGMMGKWHNGVTSGYWPWQRGFDEAFVAELYVHTDNRLLHNGAVLPSQGPTSARLTDHALKFMAESDAIGKPFFTYVSFLEPHEPWVAPAALVRKYEKKGLSKSLATVYAMVDQMDSQIGRLLAFTDDPKRREDTVVMFFSDNGPWWKSANGLSTPIGGADWTKRQPSKLKGNKGEVSDNGIRSQLLVRYGSRFPARAESALMDVTDVMPTLLDLAGAPAAPGVEGKSLRPVLSASGARAENGVYFYAKHSVRMNGAELPWGRAFDKHDLVFSQQILAAREARYKLVRDYSGGFALFNVLADPGEKQNVYGQPGVRAAQERLEAALSSWFSGVLENPKSYGVARQQVGFGGEAKSALLARAPASVSGSIQVESWTTKGYSSAGDALSLALSVRTPGTYLVSLLYTAGTATEARFSVAAAGQTLSLSSHELTPKPEGGLLRADVGEVTFSKEGAETLTLRVDSVSGGALFERLDQITLARTSAP